MASEDQYPASGFVPNLGFCQEDWGDVCDNPEITEQQWVTARSFADTHPGLVAAVERERALLGLPPARRSCCGSTATG